MFGTVGRRAVESVVAAFAILGFCFVPLGAKTGFQHTLALLETRAAREAGAGLVTAVAQARALFVSTFLAPNDQAPLPVPSGRSTGKVPVRPIPPKLPAP